MSPQVDGQSSKKSIKFNENLHHSQETSDVDLDRIQKHRMDMFKHINLHGHVSDSQMKKILYSDKKSVIKVNHQLDIEADERVKNFNKFTEKDTRIEHIDFEDIIRPYDTVFSFDKPIYENILTSEMRNIVNERLSYMSLMFDKNISYDVNFFINIDSLMSGKTFVLSGKKSTSNEIQFKR